ncbi:TFIIB-type zinc ribbon-containing protein [Oceanicola sp. S124]|uniref:TFIIB-type zinc ribbon-containing protein n=1 Tax=Oceanicola sp. S124 TaxID=1042378 RepID=UPI00025590F1|nr:zf-TFIIB domain-containing protein [Oceanicola sp. S124]
MRCPVDGTELLMTDRQGVEIDYCPTCRGVWLDRGELDKIIERSEAPAAPTRPAPSRAAPMDEGHHGAHRYDPRAQHHGNHHAPQHGSHYDKSYYKKKKRKSLLSEIFDFD